MKNNRVFLITEVCIKSMHLFIVIIICMRMCIAAQNWECSEPDSKPFGADTLIEFTYIPRYGTSENLQGGIHNVNPTNYKVAVYIFVEGSGWWTKPYFAQPLTPIQNDSTWVCDVTTGGSDVYATGIRAFLLPNGVNPPLASGLPDLPLKLDTLSIAHACTTRYGKSISFSGYDWWIKASNGLVGPGPNYFSDSADNVWVDGNGSLHLRITQRGGIWYCPEVICKNSFGYGRYVFHVASKVGQLDKNAVLGLFTWDNASADNHREIDIEFSRWGATEDTNAQYVIQPWDQSGNRHRWFIPAWIDSSIHSFNWKADSISFLSAKGQRSNPPYDSIIHQWIYRGTSIPSHGNENPRINLWLFNGTAPTDTSNLEVIITKFEYTNTSMDVGSDNHSVSTASEFRLSQNYPNPFNPTTSLEFWIPQNSHVILGIYSIVGEEIATLISRRMDPGKYLEQWNAANVPSGVYLCRLKAGSLVETRKIVLVR